MYMRLDLAKIDERIKRLQEIRRIAADPEMASILLEYVIADGADAPARMAELHDAFDRHSAVPSNDIDAPSDDAADLVKGIATGKSWHSRRS
jgi:hypothetical protein